MEGHLLCDSFDIKEEDGGKAGNSFAIDGVVGISGIN